jgi:hypothetical protein
VGLEPCLSSDDGRGRADRERGGDRPGALESDWFERAELEGRLGIEVVGSE